MTPTTSPPVIPAQEGHHCTCDTHCNYVYRWLVTNTSRYCRFHSICCRDYMNTDTLCHPRTNPSCNRMTTSVCIYTTRLTLRSSCSRTLNCTSFYSGKYRSMNCYHTTDHNTNTCLNRHSRPGYSYNHPRLLNYTTGAQPPSLTWLRHHFAWFP